LPVERQIRALGAEAGEGGEAADSFLEAGDIDGSVVWRRVLKAVKEIQRQEPREGEAAN
jgi:hypothetical protein